MFLSIITSRLAGPIASVLAIFLAMLLAASLIQNAGLKHALKSTQTRLEATQEQLGRCQSNRVTLEAAVASQNARVKAWQDEAVNRSREAEAAMRRARAGAVEAGRRIEAIRGMVAREQCGDDLILRSVR